jgi:hypothetical protein
MGLVGSTDFVGFASSQPMDSLLVRQHHPLAHFRSEDLQLSSIARYIHALDGQLQVNTVVGNTTYRLMDDVDEEISAKL